MSLLPKNNHKQHYSHSSNLCKESPRAGSSHLPIQQPLQVLQVDNTDSSSSRVSVMRQRVSASAASSPRHKGKDALYPSPKALDSRDDGHGHDALVIVNHNHNHSMSSSNNSCSCSSSDSRQRSSPRSLSLTGSAAAHSGEHHKMMHIVTTAERKCRHIPPFSLLFGTLLLATICCGVVNMATLLVLPLDHGVGGTGTNSADLARSNPLFWALLTSYTGGGVHHHGRASPRVVHLDGSEIKSRLPVAIVDNPVADTATTNNNIRQPAMVPVDPCVPMADWQTQSFVTCNMIHEIDMAVAASETTTATKDTATTLTKDTTAATASSASLTPLGEGWFRTTWRMDNADQDETVVLKTLRIIRDFSPEFYELHRRDAVAMERLTFSKYVMNVHAYCGQSAVNEMADFPVPGIQSLEALDRRMRGRDSTQADVMKLRLAASIATGVADIHAVESMDGRPAMVHYDINPRNVAITGGGRPKLNDFNIAEFLRWNPETNETCGFTSRMHEPWWRAPEEMNTTTVAKEDAVLLLDEKVDIYALGNVLYHILTTHAPRGKMKRERMEIVRPVVAQGIAPELPEPYASGTNPVYVAIRSAMALCFAKDPSERGSAEEVADLLTSAVVAVVAAHEEEDEEKGASDEPASKKDENADDDQEGGEEETE